MRPFRLKNRRFVGNRATGAHKAKKIRMLFSRASLGFNDVDDGSGSRTGSLIQLFSILNSTSSPGPDQIGVRVRFLIAKGIRKRPCMCF